MTRGYSAQEDRDTHAVCCANCLKVTPTGAFCVHCGTQHRRAYSIAAQGILQAAARRMANLTKNARTAKTVQKHEATMAAFLQFFKSKLGCDDARRAEPMDVVAWLMAKDVMARTVVHTCKPELGGSATVDCGCRTRMKSNSLGVTIGTLRASFNELGIQGEYDPCRKMGNPCASALVKQYLRSMGKEQLGAGVGVTQAPAFGIDVYDALIASLVLEASRARNVDAIKCYVAMRDALLFALLYNSLNRGSDVVALEWHDVEMYTGPAGTPLLNVKQGLDKTSQPSHTPRMTSMAGVGAITPCQLWQAWLQVTNSDEIPYGARKGRVFRPVQRMSDEDANVSTTSALASLRGALAKLQLAHAGITMHSFRASGAIAALDAGMEPDLVMAIGNWKAERMFEYYTNLRAVISLNAVKSPERGAPV